METAQESRLQLKMRTVDTGRCEVAGCAQSIDAVESKQLRNYGSKQGRRVNVWPVTLSVAQLGFTAGPERSILRFNGSISKQHPGCTSCTLLPPVSMTLRTCASTYFTGCFSASLRTDTQIQGSCFKIGWVNSISRWYEGASDSRHKSISEYTWKSTLTLVWTNSMWETTNISKAGVWSMNPTWHVLMTETTHTKVSWQVCETCCSLATTVELRFYKLFPMKKTQLQL